MGTVCGSASGFLYVGLSIFCRSHNHHLDISVEIYCYLQYLLPFHDSPLSRQVRLLRNGHFVERNWYTSTLYIWRVL